MASFRFKKTLLTSFLLANVVLSSYAEKAKISQTISFSQRLAEIEASSGGKIGIYAINAANNMRLKYRAKERFPMGCTSKVMGVAAILKKSMRDNSLLSQKIFYTKKDLANWNPITEKHLLDGMTIAELCAAAISYSDNTAMNLLVKQLGGLQGMNDFARSIPDFVFRQDHGWPQEAFSGGPNNIYDSTTPSAMANSLYKLAFSNILAKPQRKLLLTWLKGNTTGDYRIRAGIPQQWIVGDKTGTGADYGTTNDIGIVWPPKCNPIIMAIFFTSNDKKAAKREDIIAEIARLSISEFAQKDACIRNKLIS